MNDELLQAIKAYIDAQIAYAIGANETGPDGQRGSARTERRAAESAWQQVLRANVSGRPLANDVAKQADHWLR